VATMMELLPDNFASVQKFSTSYAVHRAGLPFRGTHSSGMAHTLHALCLLGGMTGKDGRLMLKRFIRWILPLMVLVLIATYFVLSPMVAGHAAGPGSSPIHMVAPQFLLPEYFSHR
jgi:Na+-translocating ferredoxin:NAD+ oxidoreductase RnfD subunit